MTFMEVAELVGLIIDAVGIVVIVLGMFYAVVRCVVRGWSAPDAYRHLRHDVGKGILLGLEFLVAADIVRTVAVKPTLDGVLVLGLIVLIRTFLSVALQVELEGRWPWQSRPPRE